MLTELGRSQAEVQRCSLSLEGPRLRSSSAHSYRTPAVEVQQCPLHAEVGEELARRTAVEVQQCPLHAEVGEELARRKWTWKWMQRWWRRSWRRRMRRRRRWRLRRRRRRRRTTVIKSNNPHLAGGEIGIKKTNRAQKKQTRIKKNKTRKEGRKGQEGRKEGMNPSGGCC